jgi:serine/threonine protein kinase/WD40 repeat protein
VEKERWQKIQALYHRARTLSSSDRPAFLAEVCANDAELRREVEEVLAADGRAGNFVETTVLGSAAEVLMPLSAGTRLGLYEILASIGAGGMGEVYRARDTRLHRTVAIKVLSASVIHGAEQRRRFLQEARAASALNHPNIVIIHEINAVENIDFIVMEYVEGRSLGQLIPPQGLPIREALNYAIQIAAGLAAAHDAGIVHRDIKPANIMVTKAGQIKILDFGVAKLVEGIDSDSATTLSSSFAGTSAGALIGTAAYMSPEQAQGAAVDARADVFSFGTVLYETLAGRRAFRGDSNIDLLAAILKDSPDPLGRIRKDVPAELSRITSRCLKKDRDERYSSAKQLHGELVSFSATLSAEPILLRASRSLIVIISVLAALAVAVWLLRGRDTSRDVMVHPVPLTSFLGSQDWPSFSPDGEHVAFSWDGEKQDNFDIYVKRIGPGPPLRLTQNPAMDTHPVWSPDGNTIAFLRGSQPGRSDVVLIPPLGGPERVVAQVALAPDYGPPCLGWSPDNKSLVICDQPASKSAAGLWLLSIETGERRQLMNVPPDANELQAPVISQDGRAMAFLQLVGPNSADLYVLALDQGLRPRGEPRRLTYDNEVIWGLAWTADGRELVYSAGAPGNLNLWRLSVYKDSRPARLFDQDVFDVFNVAVAQRSNRLVFVRSRREMDIYRAELSNKGTDAQGAMPLVASSRLDRFPSYSPDGTKIAFVSLRSGKWQLWLSDSDGANPVQLTSFDRGEVGLSTWSPDGRQIGFIGHAEGTYQAYVIDAAGGKPRKLEALGTDVGAWKWLRDGSVVFPSKRTGTLELWKMPANGGAAEQLTHHGAGPGKPTESRDGQLIYYPRQGGVWSVPAGGGVEREVFRSNFYGAALETSRAGIYFIANSNIAKDGDLMFFPFRNGLITKIPGVQARYGISVSADDRWLAYTKLTNTGSDLMLVENFR